MSTMIRIQIYLTDAERQSLDAIANQKGVTMSSVIREAIDGYIDERETNWKAGLMEIAGLWKDRNDLPDFDKLRAEADRF